MLERRIDEAVVENFLLARPLIVWLDQVRSAQQINDCDKKEMSK
jgi:hypothetical protein